MTSETRDGTLAHALGAYLKKEREGLRMTSREVEEATGKAVSNSYLSQLENGKISRPSPNILHSLATVYDVPYENLMERAGYIAPTDSKETGKKHGSAATASIDNLTVEEEQELLNYLTYVRSKRKKK